MHLSSITLTNVRQFERRTFNFQPGFNLLVGENGAGKTTILRGLLAAMGGTQQMGRRPKLEDDDIRIHASHAEVEAIIQSSHNQREEFRFRKDLWGRSERSPRRQSIPLVLFYASNEATCSAMKAKRVKQTSNTKKERLRRSEEFLYEAEMEFERKGDDASARRFGNSRSIRNFVGRVLSTFSEDFYDFYWSFEPYDCTLVAGDDADKTRLSDLSKQIRDVAMRHFQELSYRRRWWRKWPDRSKVMLPSDPEKYPEYERLPEMRDIIEEMKISDDDRRYLRGCSLEVRLTPRIMIRRRIGPLSLSQLSDGEQRLFSLFVDIARQLSLKKSRDEIGSGEAIVLIDEIDVHLHPKWQRRIVPALEDLFQRCQFIATTHSPFVIQATDRQKITPVGSGSITHGGNSIEDIAEEIQGVAVPQRSARAEKMSQTAQRYFTLLKQKDAKPESVTQADLTTAERAYREASEPFTSEPAVHALLKVQLLETRSK